MISTGLGRVNRGFELYIISLANYLSTEQENYDFSIKVYGGNYSRKQSGFDGRKISSWKRDGFIKWILPSSSKRLRLERFTFWLNMIPFLWIDKPKAIYLGEYPIYGWMYKMRKWKLIDCGLALYTGGQAIPDKEHFNNRKDFIHHITDVYLNSCKELSQRRQILLPHFISMDFEYNSILFHHLKDQAKGKLIILSVGAIEKSSKRMDLLLKSLAPFRNNVFPVLLGEPTQDSYEITEMAISLFGKGNFIIDRVNQAELGTWYQVSDGFVLCSPKESFGLSLIEAIYHGLSVASFKFPESEFVLKDWAWWLYHTDEIGLSEELSKWLMSLRNQTRSLIGHRFAFEEYSYHRLKDRYIRMFREIIDQNP